MTQAGTKILHAIQSVFTQQSETYLCDIAVIW